MNLHFRLLLTIFRALFKSKISDFEKTSENFTVLPTDGHIPLFKSMCGGRYFGFMDLGRVDQVTRLGVLQIMKGKSLGIMIGGQSIVYRKPLKVFRSFTLSTEIVSWDEKFFYVRQVFRQRENICAIGFVQATFRGKDGIYSPKKLIADIGIPDRDLEQNDGVTDWLRFRDGILEEIDRA